MSSENSGEQTTNQINMTELLALLKGQKCVVFCRVSSIGQTGGFAISFEVQEAKGNHCATVIFGMKVFQVIKVVESAYDGKKCTLKSLIHQQRGKNILIYDVSRFCRNVQRGSELLDYALKNKTRLLFVTEGIVWDRDHTWARDAIMTQLSHAEAESAAFGRRVADAKAEKKRRGFFTGGVAKYGLKVVDAEGGRKAVVDKTEQAVIEFVKICRLAGTSIQSLNQWMKRLCADFAPIELQFNGEAVEALQEPLSFVEIADLLNIYDVLRRGTKWTGASVSALLPKVKVTKKDNKKRKHDDKGKEEEVEDIEDGVEDMDLDDDEVEDNEPKTGFEMWRDLNH